MLLQFAQAKAAFEHDERFSTLTSKQTSALLERLKARLTNELVLAYSQDWVPGNEETRGMKVLQSLKDARAAAEIIDNIVSAYHAEDTGRSASDFHASVSAASSSGGLGIPACVLRAVPLRALKQAADLRDWAAFSKLFDAGKMEQLGGAISEVQDSAMIRAVTELLRNAADTKGQDAGDTATAAIEDLRGLLTCGATFAKPPAFQQDLDAMKMMSEATPEMSSDEVVSLKAAKERLEANKSSPFWRAVALFPGGQALLQKAGDVIQSHERDKAFEVELQTLVGLSKSLSRVTVATCLKAGEVTIPAANRWRELNMQLADIMTNGSQRLHKARSQELQQVAERQAELLSALKGAATQHFSESYSLAAVVVKDCTALAPRSFVASLDAAKAASEHTWAPRLKFDLKEFLNPESVAEFETLAELAKSYCVAMIEVLRWIQAHVFGGVRAVVSMLSVSRGTGWRRGKPCVWGGNARGPSANPAASRSRTASA